MGGAADDAPPQGHAVNEAESVLFFAAPAAFRAWLERVQTLNAEGQQWCASLQIQTQYDVCDEAGNTLRWADVGFSPTTMLAAVRAWDAGEDFAPSSVLP